MRPIFETEISIYLLKAYFDEKILFGKIIHLLDSTIRNKKCLQRVGMGIENSTFHSGT